MDNLAISTAHLSQDGLARAKAEQFAKASTTKDEVSTCLNAIAKVVIIAAAVFLLITAFASMQLVGALIVALPVVTVGGVGFFYSDKLVFVLSKIDFSASARPAGGLSGRAYPHDGRSGQRGATYTSSSNTHFGGGTHFGPHHTGSQYSGRCDPPAGGAGGPPQGAPGSGHTAFGGGHHQGPPAGGFGAGGPPQGAPGSGHTGFGSGHAGPPPGGQPPPGGNVPFGQRRPGNH